MEGNCKEMCSVVWGVRRSGTEYWGGGIGVGVGCGSMSELRDGGRAGDVVTLLDMRSPVSAAVFGAGDGSRRRVLVSFEGFLSLRLFVV